MLSQANCASLRPVQRPGKDPAGLWMRTRYSGIATLGRTSQNQEHTRAGCDERMVEALLGEWVWPQLEMDNGTAHPLSPLNVPV